MFSVYTEYNSFYVFALYRDYDLEFDNPYSNAFSEQKRFNDTIFEKNSYMFVDPTLADLYINSNGKLIGWAGIWPISAD